MSPEEKKNYVDYLKAEHPNFNITELVLTIEKDEETGEEMVNMEYTYENNPETNIPFNRIRRITGYLNPSLERWNNAKKAEEKDRVKHSVGCDIAEVITDE